jgi:hypothetical protein
MSVTKIVEPTAKLRDVNGSKAAVTKTVDALKVAATYGPKLDMIHKATGFTSQTLAVSTC